MASTLRQTPACGCAEPHGDPLQTVGNTQMGGRRAHQHQVANLRNEKYVAVWRQNFPRLVSYARR